MPPPRNDNPRRKNGFATPYTGAQLSTWVALPTLIVEFLVVVAPVLPLEAMIPCVIVYGIVAILAAYYAYLAQAIDPMDKHLAKFLERKANGEEDTNDNGFGGCLGGVNSELEELKHCWICETQVAENSMHCKFCNKCVGNFDHHCMWLNTCVGSANYKYFLLTMVYITAMLIVHATIQVALIIDIFLDGTSKERANDWFGLDSSGVVVGIYIGFVIFDGVALSLILQLLYFHYQLRKEGLTTYKFIVRESQRKREKLNQEQARKTQRTVAMGKAHDEGKGCLMIRLRYGEMCPCCDPLPPLEEKNDEDNHQSTTNGGAIGPQPPQVESDDDDDDDDGDDNNAAADAENDMPPEVNGTTANAESADNTSANSVNFIKVSNDNA